MAIELYSIKATFFLSHSMSCYINTSKVTSVFAFGEWHPVLKGTFDIDAYEVVLKYDEERIDFYQMGETYQRVPATDPVEARPGTAGERWRFKSPQGTDGCMWRCPETGEFVAMSLLEIKAWRYAAK